MAGEAKPKTCMRDLPGFFYNEDKGKYFPIHLKEAYEKEKKAFKSGKEKKLLEESRKTIDLYKFISNSPLKFDSLSERMSRIKVNEIIWPNKLLEIDQANDFYYRYNWINGCHCIQHVELSTGKELQSFKLKNNHVLSKFGLIRGEDCNESKYFHYLIFEKESDIKHDMFIFTPETKIYSGLSNHSSLNPDAVYYNDRIYFYGYNESSYLELKVLEADSLFSTCEILPRSIDFLAAFPETGLIQVHKGGLIIFKDMEFTLFRSSAKWLHYYEGKLLILTYHGQLLALSLSTKAQDIILDIKDLDLSESKFEHLIIDAKGKLVIIGYKNSRHLIFFNWIEKKVIKKLSLTKPIEQFKISLDLLNLYIHTLQ